MIADYMEVAISAVNLVSAEDLNSVDRVVPGIYGMRLDAGLAEPLAASVALSKFFEEYPIENREDFDFFVFDPATGRVLQSCQEIEADSEHVAWDLSRISGDILHQYMVGIEARAVDNSVAKEGMIAVAASTTQNAYTLARGLWWTEELTSKGLTPRFEIIEADDDEEVHTERYRG